MPLFHHHEPKDDAPEEPAEEAAHEVPAGMVESLYPGGGLEPDLIGDEWKQGSPDQAVPEPNELEWDLAEPAGALFGGWGEVDPAPIVPMPEAAEHPDTTHHHHKDKHG